MDELIDPFVAAAAETTSERALNTLFSRTINTLGYHAFDAYRHRVNDTVDLDDPANFLVASYDPGILAPYLAEGMAEMCPALMEVSESSVSFDYIAFLDRQPPSTSVIWQRRTLRAFLVHHAWCIPLNTVTVLKGVTVYMVGKGSKRVDRFLATRHAVALLATYYMEALESYRPGPRGRALGRPGTPPAGRSVDLSSGPALSAREIDCLHWAASGKSNPEIASILTVSPNTIRFHMKNAYRKLNAPSRLLAVDKARAMGLI